MKFTRLRKYPLEYFYGRKPSILLPKKSEMLLQIMQHAYHTSPYYKKVFDSVGVPASVCEALEILPFTPVLDKKLIRNENSNILSDMGGARRERQYWNTSGGSTGEPIRILQDLRYLEAGRYITYSQKKNTGFKWGEPLIKVWGDENELFNGNQGIKQQIINLIKNQTVLNSFRMTDLDMAEYLQVIKNSSKGLIVAYVQSLYQLALFAKENGISVKFDGSIIVSAGTLYPFMKKEILDVFGAPVFNRYGSREVGNIGISSNFSDSFTLNKGCWVEVVDDAGHPLPLGSEGEIVVTSLINYSMPLVRYKLGDRGVLSLERNRSCEAEVVLSKVTGRSVDLFFGPGGAKIDGEYFTHLLYFRDWVVSFQFVQKTLNLVEVNYVEKETPPKSDLTEIKQKVQYVMGPQCCVVFRSVSEIKSPKSGKFRFTINEIGSEEIIS